MTTKTMAHPLKREAIAVFQHSWLTQAAKELMNHGGTAGDYLLTLTSQNRYEDAIQSLVFAMPNRQGVWWLCQCLWLARGSYHSPLDQAAFKAAVAWVMNPTAETAEAAQRASDAADFESAARCAAGAAHLAGAGPWVDAPMTTPQQRMATQLVAGGLSLMALAADDAGIEVDAAQIFQLGLDVVHGASHWDTILSVHAINQHSKQ